MPIRVLTSRDADILTALDRVPLTAQQLLKLSQTFAAPFPHERLLRRRLLQLAESGLVRRAQYMALAGHGGIPNYYLLTPLGLRMLYGENAEPPAKRFGHPVAPSHQQHTHALAEFLVHVGVGAHELGVALSGYHGENRIRLSAGGEAIYPDCAFQLVVPGGPEYSFFVELDNRTERIASPHDTNSWERKIRVYEAVQDQSRTRFRVLALCTRSSQRIDHILELAARVARNPRRSLVYAAALPAFLDTPQMLCEPVFRDHRGAAVALLPDCDRFAASSVLRRTVVAG